MGQVTVMRHAVGRQASVILHPLSQAAPMLLRIALLFFLWRTQGSTAVFPHEPIMKP